jgi:hypothetical protein
MTTFTDEKFDYFNQIREDLGLDAVWSIYEVENLSERHPFKGAKKVIYRAYGSGNHEVAIEGDTWKSLYIAANQLIRDSGDGHHIYIESFKQSSISPEILFVTTGS